MTVRHVRVAADPLPTMADASPEATDGWPREAADHAADDIRFSTFPGPPHQVEDPGPAVAQRPPSRWSSLDSPSTKMEVFGPEDRPAILSGSRGTLTGAEVTKGRVQKRTNRDPRVCDTLEVPRSTVVISQVPYSLFRKTSARRAVLL